MAVDIKNLNHNQLNELITKAQVRQTELRKEKVAKLREKIHAMVKAEGYSMEDIFGGARKARRSTGTVAPKYRNPANPAQKISEPPSFVQDLAAWLGPFYTTGFQEDHKARTNGIFDDAEYIRQAGMVLEERLALFERALDHLVGRDGAVIARFAPTTEPDAMVEDIERALGPAG